ncbi:major tail protein [Streptococcus phage vB_SthS_VA460]|uniref:Major tail protein n=1 Tax=Streptococcus phage vB_SthS_VA460 TaxID=2069609 RepID=A0A2I6QR14_9CAUD|nr:major tail protein [Streptococcus phage vB_SthS_VA460]AUN43461.1 major tail protein [Streptococcus phage vB_SthS_VA460]
MIESQTLDRKNSVFFGFANGIMQESTQNIGTDTDTDQTRQNDNMTYSALSAIAFNGEPIKKYFSGDSKFDKANMYKEVFGGYVFSGDGVGH